MPTLATRWGDLDYDDLGAGTPLVLLHSGGHDRRDFDAVRGALARDFRLIVPDLPGHGRSTWRAAPAVLRASDLCAAALALADHLALPPAIWLGNSVGGMACLHAAAHRPERVRALVLVSPSGLVEQSATTRAFCWLQGRRWIRRRLGVPFAKHYLAGRGAETLALLARIAASRRDAAHVAREAALWRSFGQPDSDLAALAPSIRRPTALVWGLRDPVLRAAVEGARARRLLPHATWHPLADRGHVPFVEDPEGFLRVLAPLIAPLRASAPRAPGAPAGETGAPA